MLRHAENFAVYGTGTGSRANMLRHPRYLEVAAGVCSTANPFGLGTHHFRWVASNVDGLRIALEAAVTETFVSARFCVDALPAGNQSTVLFQMLDAAANPQLSLALSSTGTLILLRGERGGIFGGTILAESDIVFAANAYGYVEMFCVISDTVGEVEVRVDGETVINVSAVDTQATALTNVSQYICCNSIASGGVTIDMTDLSENDASGAINDDFLGDTTWLRRDMTSDAAATQWTRNTGASDFAAIDDVTPDDDTTYVEALADGDLSEYGIQDLPTEASEVVGVVLRSLARQAAVGIGTYNVGLRSALTSPSVIDAGPDITTGSSFDYTDHIIDVDPATGIHFTPSGFNACLAQLERNDP